MFWDYFKNRKKKKLNLVIQQSPKDKKWRFKIIDHTKEKVLFTSHIAYEFEEDIHTASFDLKGVVLSDYLIRVPASCYGKNSWDKKKDK